MGTMLRRIPGKAQWRVFVNGDYYGDVYQNPDGTWMSNAAGAIGGLGESPPAGTRRDAAKYLIGKPVTQVG